MARKLHVYLMNWNGKELRMVAAHSQREAAALLGVTLHDFRGYGNETSDAEQVSLAMQEPGVVWRQEYRHAAPWVRVQQGAKS